MNIMAAAPPRATAPPTAPPTMKIVLFPGAGSALAVGVGVGGVKVDSTGVELVDSTMVSTEDEMTVSLGWV